MDSVSIMQVFALEYVLRAWKRVNGDDKIIRFECASDK